MTDKELEFENDIIDKELEQQTKDIYFVAEDLKDFLDASVSMYHAVQTSIATLEESNFQKIELTENWELEKGGKYYLAINDSTILAFRVGNDVKKGFRIIGSHTDSPGFKVKANPTIKKDGYIQLNTEVYGGPLLRTWFDRPLSIAGRVFIKGESSHKPKVELVNLDYDLMTIPSLAIHMIANREESDKPNPQIHTLPVVGLGDDFDLNELIAEELNIDVEDIITHDLFVYNRETATIIGANSEFISSGKIDNLGMVHASLNSIITAEPSDNTQVFVAFDNEEIGSSTLQGASSAMFRDVLRKISLSLGNTEVEFINQIYDSYMISADQAHAIHPNYLERADLTNRPKLNEGPVIKDSAVKSYATDGFGRAVLLDLAKEAGVPMQMFHNRSDSRGGSTIGSIIETNTGIRNIDIGNPMLAMHSAREMAGVLDQLYMTILMIKFYETK